MVIQFLSNKYKTIRKMRYKFIFLLVVFFKMHLVAQEVIERDSTRSNSPQYYEFKTEQSNAWKIIEKKWEKEYLKILKEQGLKMSCQSCENIYIDVAFTIDEKGKLKYYKLINSKKCEEKFTKGLELRFMKWFFNYKFPEELYNMNFQVRLGNSLKC